MVASSEEGIEGKVGYAVRGEVLLGASLEPCDLPSDRGIAIVTEQISCQDRVSDVLIRYQCHKQIPC